MLGNVPTGRYFEKVLNKAFHDLTYGKYIPPAAQEILGLSMKFIPTPRYTTCANQLASSFDRLERDIFLKTYFAGDEDDLFTSSTPTKSKLYVKSTWSPPLPPYKIDKRLSNLGTALRKIFVRTFGKPNLNTFQRKLLDKLRSDDSIVYCNSDKGLGPVGVTLKWYQKEGLKHLNNKNNYEIISEATALDDAHELRMKILFWLAEHRDALDDNAVKYIRKKLKDTKEDPFGYFYLLIKLHKNPISTRPVCSDCGSLPHALGQWVDEQLQPIVQSQHTYFKNSFALKQELDKMLIPPNASLFTYDAVSMYTNIDTDNCINRLKTFFDNPITLARWGNINKKDALMQAIELVMRNNRMRFGDIIVRQLSGIAMGMSPAPTIANLYVAIHEKESILNFLTSCLLYLRRFIDDGLGIWIMTQTLP